MKPSPLRSLLYRHVCCCRTVPSLLNPLTQVSIRASPRISTRNASSYANPPPTYGSSELLKRRYQPTPESKRLSDAERAKALKRMKYSAIGIILCALGIFGTVYTYPDARKTGNAKQKPASPRSTSLDGLAGVSTDSSLYDEAEQVPTGTSTIPTFPKTIHLSSLDPPLNAAA